MENDRIEALELALEASERKVYDLRAQLASRMGDAFMALHKTGDYMGSAVILSVTALGGKEIVPPVAIRDGLSRESISALQEDLRRSFELATLVNPAMARNS